MMGFYRAFTTMMVVGLFDMIVGWQFCGVFLDLCATLKTDGGHAVLYVLTISCTCGSAVQIIMGFILFIAAFFQCEMACRFYIYVTAATFLVSVPFVFRIVEMFLIAECMETCRKLTFVADCILTGNFDLLGEENKSFTTPSQLKATTELQNQNTYSNANSKDKVQTVTAANPVSAGGLPPAYTICVSGNKVQEESPPPYFVAIEMSGLK